MLSIRSELVACCFFFFKQKTAYEVRISDWSSDVCSSDLHSSGTRRKRPPLSFTSRIAGSTSSLSERAGPLSIGIGSVSAWFTQPHVIDRYALDLHRQHHHAVRCQAAVRKRFSQIRRDRKSTRLNSSH